MSERELDVGRARSTERAGRCLRAEQRKQSCVHLIAMSDRSEEAMPRSAHGPMINDPDQYEALRDQGMSKEKAARISNASFSQGRSAVARRGGRARDYDERTKEELLRLAREVGIEGRSRMSKAELIRALRNG
jgi:hypothetical protein